jgi:hypothetical protein
MLFASRKIKVEIPVSSRVRCFVSHRDLLLSQNVGN